MNSTSQIHSSRSSHYSASEQEWSGWTIPSVKCTRYTCILLNSLTVTSLEHWSQYCLDPSSLSDLQMLKSFMPSFPSLFWLSPKMILHIPHLLSAKRPRRDDLIYSITLNKYSTYSNGSWTYFSKLAFSFLWSPRLTCPISISSSPIKCWRGTSNLAQPKGNFLLNSSLPLQRAPPFTH